MLLPWKRERNSRWTSSPRHPYYLRLCSSSVPHLFFYELSCPLSYSLLVKNKRETTSFPPTVTWCHLFCFSHPSPSLLQRFTIWTTVMTYHSKFFVKCVVSWKNKSFNLVKGCHWNLPFLSRDINAWVRLSLTYL